MMIDDRPHIPSLSYVYAVDINYAGRLTLVPEQ